MATSGATTVVATWIEPTLNCQSTPNGDVAIWVGVDGADNSNLFQSGTDASCINGRQSDAGWWEELPQASNPFGDRDIAAGDSITTQISQTSPGYWTYQVTDNTNGASWGAQTPIAYNGPGSTAEWIVEDPTNGNTRQFEALPNFGTVTLTNIGANNYSGSISGIEMVQHNQVLSLPSSYVGGSFSVSYG